MSIESIAFSRRGLLKGAVAAAVAVGVAACSDTPPRTGASSGGAAGERALPIPPLLEPRTVGAQKIYTLNARAAASQILPDEKTPTWGYNGSMLGPTIRAHRGDDVRLEVSNSLPEMTTVHWHGMHLPAATDGGPHQPIDPGTTWSPEWTINQQAATLWYHPHPHGTTSLHTYRGLAGLFIIDDEHSDAVDLPKNYGVDDIPLIVQDRRFNGDGTLDESDLPDVGLLGNVPIVNGITHPTFTATTHRVRFRIVNGATMRLFNLQFSDGRKFHIVASDGGLLNEPEEVTSTYISPGERIEIVVDLVRAETVTLRAVKFVDNLELNRHTAPNFGLSDQFDLMTITGPRTSAAAPPPLPRTMNDSLLQMPPIGGAVRRAFDMKQFRINDKVMDLTRVDEVITPERWEVWTVSNKDKWIHNFHVHDTQFRILALTRTSTTPQTIGWKDTVLLAPGAVATLAVRFTDYTSTRWPYMYHCHLMYHEDHGMMGQFVVVNPGQYPDPKIGKGLEGQHDVMPGIRP